MNFWNSHVSGSASLSCEPYYYVQHKELPSLKMLKVIDPSGLTTNDINQICELCVRAVSANSENTAVRNEAAHIIIQALAARTSILSEVQYCQVLERLQELKPFEDMDLVQKETLARNWFEFAIQLKAGDDTQTVFYRGQLLSHLMKIYEFENDNERLLQVSILFSKACTTYLAASASGSYQIFQAIDLSRDFLRNNRRLNPDKNSKYLELERTLLIEGVIAAPLASRLTAFTNYLQESYEWHWIPESQEQFYCAMRGNCVDFSELFKWGPILFNGSKDAPLQQEIIVWMMTRALVKNKVFDQGKFHFLMHCLLSLNLQSKIRYIEECKGDISILFTKMNDLDFNCMEAVCGKEWLIEPFDERFWLRRIEKLTDFIQTILQSSRGIKSQVISAMHDYMMVHLLSSIDLLSLTTFEKSLRCCQQAISKFDSLPGIRYRLLHIFPF